MHVKDDHICIRLENILNRHDLSDEMAEAILDWLIFDPRFISRMVDAILGINGDDSEELQNARHRFMRKFDEMSYWEAKEGRRHEKEYQRMRNNLNDTIREIQAKLEREITSSSYWRKQYEMAKAAAKKTGIES